MAHEIAKLVLEHAGTFVERTEAVRTALSMGMPLGEIQAYLDWLDLIRHIRLPDAPSDDRPPENPGGEIPYSPRI